MEQETQLRYEPPERPQKDDLQTITPNTESFNNPEKAEAIIKFLHLQVGDTIRENEDYFTINPQMVLEGDTPEHYKKTIEDIKKILTAQEIKSITKYMQRKTEDKKARDKIYYGITKRTDKKFYFRGNIKKSTPTEIKEILERLHSSLGFYNTIFHLLEKEETDYRTCYKMAWLNKPIPNIQKWNERDEGEYRILTDSEADQASEDYFDDDDLWRQAVESKNTDLGREDWEKQVIDIDGRGSLLAGYDGAEETEEVNGTTYYIYRTN